MPDSEVTGAVAGLTVEAEGTWSMPEADEEEPEADEADDDEG